MGLNIYLTVCLLLVLWHFASIRVKNMGSRINVVVVSNVIGALLEVATIAILGFRVWGVV